MNYKSTSITTISLTVVALSLAISGCATVSQTAEDFGHKVGITDAKTAAATIGAVGGCVAGGMLGMATGMGAAKGCVAGAVVGGAVSMAGAYQREMEQARKLADDAKAAGVKTTVVEKTVVVEEKSAVTGKVESKEVPSVNTITLDLPKTGVNNKSDETANVVMKAANLAANASRPVVVDVYGTKAQTAWIGSLLDAKFAGTQASYKTHADKAPKMVLSMMPAPTPAVAKS